MFTTVLLDIILNNQYDWLRSLLVLLEKAISVLLKESIK